MRESSQPLGCAMVGPSNVEPTQTNVTECTQPVSLFSQRGIQAQAMTTVEDNKTNVGEFHPVAVATQHTQDPTASEEDEERGSKAEGNEMNMRTDVETMDSDMPRKERCITEDSEIDTLSEGSSSDEEDGDNEKDSASRRKNRRYCIRRPRRLRLRKWFLIILVLLAVMWSILAIGTRIEGRRMRGVPTTVHLYDGSDVCAMNGNDDVTTFASADQAHHAGQKVAHCGSCGECSTLQDMEIMGRTKDTLTHDSTMCALLIFVGGKKAVSRCMRRNIGFTTPCNDCWVDNIQCTFEACKFTCLTYKIFGESNNNDSGELNSCLQCDEKMCGPEFLTCSGANRRRMGVVSDIGRDQESEQCKSSDFDWAAA